jgi:2Fe-2S ferredoxin
MPAVMFLPWAARCDGETGDTLLQVALDHGVPLPHSCGGDAVCSTCAVEILSGMGSLSAIEEIERETLDKLLPKRSPGTRLGCQVRIMGEDEIITARSL